MPSGMAGPAALCLVLGIALLALALPRGLTLGPAALPLAAQAALLGGALAAGLWAVLSARPGRVALGALLALALLAPAHDPRLAPERLPLYLGAAVLLLLAVEFGLLHAKIARLAALPRAHVAREGAARELDLRATASRIAGSWPAPLALGLVALGAAFAIQHGFAALAPPALGESVEARGPFGLALAAALVLAALGLAAWRRRAQGGSAGP